MTLPLPDEDVLYRASSRRDPAFEGVFIAGVRTTGIYCRPGCPARMPRRENVDYFPDAAGARRAGHRACRRCRPDAPASSLRWFPDALGGLVDRADVHPGDRPGGVDALITRVLWTRLGPMIGAATDEGLAFLEFAFRDRLQRQSRLLRQRFGATFVEGEHPVLDGVERELREYFAGRRVEFTTPLALRGTAFQCEVWRALRELPLGSLCSYGELARRLGRPRATRAVGHANGDNPLTIVVPCHRLVASDGSLRDYGGGLWRKAVLVEHEAHRRAAAAPTL